MARRAARVSSATGSGIVGAASVVGASRIMNRTTTGVPGTARMTTAKAAADMAAATAMTATTTVLG